MGIKVRAKAKGYYKQLREKGETFEIADQKAFSSRWMEQVRVKAPEPKAASGKPSKK